MERTCEYCGSTTGCAADTGWPCTAERVEAIENAYYGNVGLAQRGYRSFWD
jgi:hypothetical protein